MRILVTGGAGYIGSHTCVALLQAGYEVIVADNFSNSTPQVLERVRQIAGRQLECAAIDVTDAAAVDRLFEACRPQGVIHFAGYKAVAESVQKPLAYYRNNIDSTLVLAEACEKHGVNRFVFSSSATVYGDNLSPLTETLPLQPATNPYGETKLICEWLLTDLARVRPQFSVSLLRYFNPVGAHPCGLIGERPQGIPNNLMPYVTQVAAGRRDRLSIFGNDYPTPDGTGVRDFIHVMDLAEGHLAALEQPPQGVRVYNLGTGQGVSVLQLVETFAAVNGVAVPYEIAQRRAGDIAACWADASRARQELGWQAKRSLADMCRDAWRFEQGNT